MKDLREYDWLVEEIFKKMKVASDNKNSFPIQTNRDVVQLLDNELANEVIVKRVNKKLKDENINLAVTYIGRYEGSFLMNVVHYKKIFLKFDKNDLNKRIN